VVDSKSEATSRWLVGDWRARGDGPDQAV
jgi:hypothetical protein